MWGTSDEYDTSSLATDISSGIRPVIHNVPRHAPPPINIDTTHVQSGSPSNSYRTTVVTPQGVYDEIQTDRSQQRQQAQQPPSHLEWQQDPGYYDPRGSRSTAQAPMIRRNSLTSQERPRLGRSNSTRGTDAPQIRQVRR